MKSEIQTSEITGKSSPQVPNWLTPEEARATLSRDIEQFLALVIAGKAENKTLVLRATAGIGKTNALLTRLGTAAHHLLSAGHIQIMLPTHDLADEAHALFESLFPEVPSRVFRGRDAIHPSTGRPMCERADLVARVSEICGSVSQSLCQTWCPFRKRMRRADCYDRCAWRAQIPEQNSVIFMAHAYLTSGTPIQGDVVLRVIDEKFFSGLLTTNSISSGNWLPIRKVPAAPGSEDERLDRCRATVLDALRTGAPVNAGLRGAGFDRNDIKKFGDLERWKAERLAIYPDQKKETQSEAVRGYDLHGLRAARSRASVWDTIARSWELDATDRLTLVERREGDITWQSIQIHRCKEINTTIPTILLDADADPAIIKTFRPDARFVNLDVAPNANITQIRDRTFSTASLCSAPGAEDLRRKVRTVIEREVSLAEGRGVLLVATQEVLHRLHRDEDRDRPVDTDDDLLVPLFGAKPRWYGPRLQGINNYSDFGSVILLGRLEPPVDAVDNQLRCLAGDRNGQLALAGNVAAGCGWFPGRQGYYLRRGDTFEPARVRHHPDPIGAALLTQIREANTLQAMARIRAIGATAPKRVVILCSVPLPGVPVDDLPRWDEFVTGVPATLGPKVAKLREAIRLPDGTRKTCLRLSVDGILQDAPHVFRTRNAAAEWRRDLTSDSLPELIGHVQRLEGMDVSGVLLRGAAGRPTPAIVMASKAEAVFVARELWPNVRSIHPI